jgi:hypothetical protein
LYGGHILGVGGYGEEREERWSGEEVKTCEVVKKSLDFLREISCTKALYCKFTCTYTEYYLGNLHIYGILFS